MSSRRHTLPAVLLIANDFVIPPGYACGVFGI